MLRSPHFFATLLAPPIALLLALSLGMVPVASAVATASISGIVTGPGAAPLFDVAVTAYRANPTYGYWEPVAQGRSDTAGSYRIDSLPTGTYRLEFDDSSGDHVAEYFADALTLDTATGIPVTDGATVSGIDAELALAGHITGQVTGTGGAPAANISVKAYRLIDGDWQVAARDGTTAAGNYNLGGLPTGNYRIKFSDELSTGYVSEYFNDAATVMAATDVPVTAGATTSGKDAQLAPGGHIVGVVTGAGDGALYRITVTVYQRDAATGFWDELFNVPTDFRGYYHLGGLPSGIYRIGFADERGTGYISEYFNDAATVNAATDISVTTGATESGKDAQLAPGAHITGTVTGAGGAPLQFVQASAYQWDAVNGYWDFVSYGRTGADGAYDVGGLATGTYRIAFDDYHSATYVREYYDNVLTVEAATDIPVTAGTTTPGKNAQLSTTPPTDPTPSPTPTVPTGTAPLGPVPPATVPTISPLTAITAILADVHVAGKLKVGKTLKLTKLSASYRGTVGYKIRWYMGKKAIKRPTRPTLKLTSALRGKVISVKVTAISSGVSKNRKIRVGRVR